MANSNNNPTYQKINWGWLNDYNGYKFAPITFVEQLYTEDGFPFLDKYNDTKNCPKYKSDGKLYYVFSLFVSRPMNSNKFLHLICSINDYTPAENFIINSMDRLVEVLGEELVLQIWDYIK